MQSVGSIRLRGSKSEPRNNVTAESIQSQRSRLVEFVYPPLTPSTLGSHYYGRPVPFEALIPFGIIAGFFGASGAGMHLIKYYTNDRKPTRYGLDLWDKQMMERDRRLTGSLRGQSAEPVAPAEFATNSVWYLETPRKT
ncbi:hypothetical protein VTP01DRAFT_6922 [Rhizomucor pusillus]|uniref:uncharacterized protein n=1 Tax=Rhizomucor pusillus TaxID=4840 RepID=UPI003742A4CF